MKGSSSNIFRFLLHVMPLALALAIPSLNTYSQVNAEQVMTIGRNVMSMEDYMLSIQYFNQAIKAKPYLADPYLYRAIAKLSLDDFKGAEDDCNKAIELNKFKTEAYKVRGFARQCMGKEELAIGDYDEGLSHNPIDRHLLFYKAVALTELEKFDSADSVFATLLRNFPKFEEGYSARGRLNLERGDTTAALNDLETALKLSKSLINPYLTRAAIEWKRKQWDKAAEDMDAAIRLRPEVSDLYVNRAFIRYNSDDFFGAMSDYNYALELDPKNASALFNRGLLRYEVKDLARSEQDMTSVLDIDPTNFHALYNRGLIRMEQGKNEEALSDFDAISKKYPRFYPVYYAMAETKRNMGNMRSAMQLAHHADGLVEKYVKNPEKNPLDRPAIAAAESNDRNEKADHVESEIEVMDKFNRLVTVSDAVETQLSYNEKIKGRVQDRNVHVEPEPMYALTLSETPITLKSVSNYFRDLDDLNQHRYINKTIYLNPGIPGAFDQDDAQRLFAYADELKEIIASGKGRPIDRLALGITLTMLKNYPEAIENLDKVIETDDKFTVAYMARAFARYINTSTNALQKSDDNEKNRLLDRRSASLSLQEVINDYDKALQLNPRLVYAWFNKGNIYYAAGDMTSALQCYGEAIKIDPSFGEAYFNRGLSYLQSGNKNHAFSDLSKAGELGVLPSYNILKRMQ